VNLTGGDRPEQLKGIHASADYFKLFGAQVEVGRTFSKQEDVPGGPRLVVISSGLWRRRFGGDRSLVGKAILLRDEPYIVIGILSPSFASDPAADIWLPLQADPNSANQAHFLRAAARLKPGITLGIAKAQMKLVTEQFRQKYADVGGPEGPKGSFTVEPLRDVVVGDVRLALLVLIGAVSFVLLIACVNVANLVLVRATRRRREMAIRAALGAGRRRIVFQSLTESVLLSIAGGGLGLVLGYVGVHALLAINPGDIPRIGAQGSAVMLDWHVLAFTLLISVFTGILFGLMPAFHASYADVSTTLNESGTRSGSGLRQNKARSILIITEMALALVLLAGAGLLIRTFMALRTVDPGFDVHNVLAMEMSLNETRFEKTVAIAELLATPSSVLRAYREWQRWRPPIRFPWSRGAFCPSRLRVARWPTVRITEERIGETCRRVISRSSEFHCVVDVCSRTGMTAELLELSWLTKRWPRNSGRMVTP
jgi:predicted permease